MRVPTRRLIIAGSVVAVAGAAALPAFAASPVPVPVTTSTSIGQRTLQLSDGAGNALGAAAGLTLIAGRPSTVIAGVKDAGYSTSNFQVSSTMTNLYQNTGAVIDYGSLIPSSAVSVSRSAVPVSLSSVSTHVAPVFTLTGNLTTALAGSLGALVPTGGLTAVTTQVTGSLQNLVVTTGTTIDPLLAGLPLKIAGGSQGAYVNPASLGGSDPITTSTSATTIPLLSSTTPAGLSATLLTQLQGALGASPTLASLTGGATPVINPADVATAVASQLNLPISVVTANLPAVITALNPTLSSLTGGAVDLTGVYSGNNTVTVTPPVGTVAGTFKGLLTVTLTDTP